MSNDDKTINKKLSSSKNPHPEQSGVVPTPSKKRGENIQKKDIADENPLNKELVKKSQAKNNIKDASKIASSVASGNYVGAAKTVAKSQLGDVGAKDAAKIASSAATGDYAGAAKTALKTKSKKEKPQENEPDDNSVASFFGKKAEVDDDSAVDDFFTDDDSSDGDEKKNDSKDAVKKAIVGATVATQGAKVGVGAFMISKIMGAAKAVGGAVVSAASTVGGGVMAVGSTLAATLGTSALIGNVLATVVVTSLVGTTAATGIGAVASMELKDDSEAICIPSITQVSKESQKYVEGGGEAQAIKEEYAIKLMSIFEAKGADKMHAAGILGNFDHESGIDPTTVETIFDEPYQIGPRKQHAIDVDFAISQIDSSYSARFPAIKNCGIGLGQWTNGRNRLLLEYAKGKSGDWHNFDIQVMFMLEGDEPSRVVDFTDFIGTSVAGSNVDDQVLAFMRDWEGVNYGVGERLDAGRKWMVFLATAASDTNYANSILSRLNQGASAGNHAAGAFHQDDGCGDEILDHYRNKSADGTGVVPEGLTLEAWTPKTFPDSLKEFYYNPEDAGLVYGSDVGWQPAGPDGGQCVALSHAYFMQIYAPTPVSHPPMGNGVDIAGAWASIYGQSTTTIPSAGAVFSDGSTSVWGHTGMVQHVFANGDILICEQNLYGISGDNNGTPRTWGWRVILKDRLSGWEFFKPAGVEPQWEKNKKK